MYNVYKLIQFALTLLYRKKCVFILKENIEYEDKKNSSRKKTNIWNLSLIYFVNRRKERIVSFMCFVFVLEGFSVI